MTAAGVFSDKQLKHQCAYCKLKTVSFDSISPLHGDNRAFRWKDYEISVPSTYMNFVWAWTKAPGNEFLPGPSSGAYTAQLMWILQKRSNSTSLNQSSVSEWRKIRIRRGDCRSIPAVETCGVRFELPQQEQNPGNLRHYHNSDDFMQHRSGQH